MSKFPKGLLDWSGNKVGGVRRLFHDKSGRPAGAVIRTSLLDRVDDWAMVVAKRDVPAPKIVLLVGGPGNGKTEAVEYAICRLDAELGSQGALVKEFTTLFNPAGQEAPPRLAAVAPSGRVPGLSFRLEIVQDASAPDGLVAKSSPAELFALEIGRVLQSDDDVLYLACVNRGILDDALIYATDKRLVDTRRALIEIIASIEAGPGAGPCWPLQELPRVAAWPMDVETLLSMAVAEPPGAQLMAIATGGDSWPERGECAAGERCPFCFSRERLSQSFESASLIRILRWYELGSGKRWSFRDLSSLLSLLLAGTRRYPGLQLSSDPCGWAAALLEGKGSDRVRLAAPYILVAAQFQHSLFSGWPRISARQLRRDLDQLSLRQDGTLAGLHYFLTSSPETSAPPTLIAQLASIRSLLDPALAHPDTVVKISEATQLRYRDIDVRFGQSTREGTRYLLKGARRGWFSPAEVALMESLADADERISTQDLARKHPAAAFRVQAVIRSFACSVARRSLGVRSAAVRDWESLAEYEKVVGGDKGLLQGVLKQVQALLNENEKFRVCLNTTFGEPMPPPDRQAMLVTPLQKLKVIDKPTTGRPPMVFPFLRIGSAGESRAIPLTYDLFKAGAELRKGMLAASLPRPVVALIDATRARLAGQLVRKEDLLEDAEIHIGKLGGVVAFDQETFVYSKEAHQ